MQKEQLSLEGTIFLGVSNVSLYVYIFAPLSQFCFNDCVDQWTITGKIRNEPVQTVPDTKLFTFDLLDRLALFLHFVWLSCLFFTPPSSFDHLLCLCKASVVD